MEMLSEGFTGKTEEVFGQGFVMAPSTGPDTPDLADLRAKAERAQPKPTEKNQLYANFGKKLEEGIPLTPEQLAAAQARREAAAKHQEVSGHLNSNVLFADAVVCLQCSALCCTGKGHVTVSLDEHGGTCHSFSMSVVDTHMEKDHVQSRYFSYGCCMSFQCDAHVQEQTHRPCQ
jgi:hypothetical protein